MLIYSLLVTIYLAYRSLVQSLHADRDFLAWIFEAALDTWDGRIAVLSYVSLGSLTSVGSDAVVPVGPAATMLTTLEAVFGQFYIAVVVAQLVGARLSQAPQRSSARQV
jgi:hypothetical protein